MSLTVQNAGYSNVIKIDPEVIENSSGTISVKGNHNVVSIDQNSSLENANINLGNNCSFASGRGCRLASLEVMATFQGHVTIGSDSNFTWYTRIFLHEPGRVQIGSGCLISTETILTISDMHSLIDLSSGMRLNPAADIVLEDNVWLAYGVTILKGSRIGRGSVIGLGSIVSRNIPPNTLAAGRPASALRTNVSWDAALL